jgi:hypothetical protein
VEPRHIILTDAKGMEKPPASVTMHEFLSKPDRAVTRQELAAFFEAVFVGEVAPLVKQALRHYDHNEVRDTIASMIVAREQDIREHRWYRRLWQWIAGFWRPKILLTGERLEKAVDASRTLLAETKVPSADAVGE